VTMARSEVLREDKAGPWLFHWFILASLDKGVQVFETPLQSHYMVTSDSRADFAVSSRFS
jgi:hypothetical protein